MGDIFPKIYPFPSVLVAPAELSKEPFAVPPVGIVIHYTADRGMERIRRTLIDRGLGYHLIIGRDGKIEQHAWLNCVVWHAGKAVWRGFSPNHHFLAVALESWGELKQVVSPLTNPPIGIDQIRYEAWNKSIVDPEDVEERVDNVQGKKLFWDAATREQLISLHQIIKWAKGNGIDPQNICGHDECAIPPGRKIDPGGVLPVTMKEYRRVAALVDSEEDVA